MAISDTYKVVTTGQILEGFDPAEVRKHLVSALRLKPEVAERFFEQARVVKKDVSWASADKICAQLAKLGVAAEIQSPPPPIEAETALEPEPATSAAQLEIVDYESTATPKEETIECPNCQHVQAKSEQCENCGAWFHKFEATAAAAAPASAAVVAPAAAASVSQAAETVDSADQITADDIAAAGSALSPAAIVAAAVTALVGAWVWKFVGVTFEYELGLIAWGIGGAVGFAAAAMGSHGMQAGIICSVLALGSIVIGKYWTYSAFVDEFETALTEVTQDDGEMQDYYEEQLADARRYVQGSDNDDFVRSFMVERGYTYETSAGQISDAELQDFREYIAPALVDMAENSPDFDDWQETTLEAVSEMSPWSMMKDSLGLLDLLFAFLGIGTAFRLGSQRD